MNVFDNALRQLETAVKLMDLDQKVLMQLSVPEKVIMASLPVSMDDGSTKIFEAYRVQYNSARGPYKGGIRFHPQVDLDEVRALAFWMSIKTAVVDIPMGGGKGGVIVDPKSLSQKEIENLSRSWVRAFRSVIGPDKDIPAPDVYTNPQIMAWMADEFSQLEGKRSLGVVTGKPLEFGGSKGRGQATAKGGFYVLQVALEKANLKPEKTKVAIQGFGNAGMTMAQLLYEAGYKVVSVADSKATLYNDSGLDIAKVIEHKNENKVLSGYKDAKEIEPTDIFGLEVDVLIPAALENQITDDNAPNIKAKIILELANGPTTPEADQILFDKEVVVIPDVLANAGGVTVSYFEWLQNISHNYWSEEEVDSELKERMVPAYEKIWEIGQEKKIQLRMAAFILALERIQAAMRVKGS